MDRKSKKRVGLLTDIALILGAVTVTVGVALLCLPAGIIVGGIMELAGGVLYALGGDGQ